jgi:predicted transcriptional regulator
MNRLLRFLRSPSVYVGPLEQQLMEALWTRGSATVRELLDEEGLSLAYTTVMTTLDRLYKKRLLRRLPEGRAYRYSPAWSREELERAVAAETIHQLLESGAGPSLPLSYLVEAVTEHDVRLLDDLQEALNRKRQELRLEKIATEKH